MLVSTKQSVKQTNNCTETNLKTKYWTENRTENCLKICLNENCTVCINLMNWSCAHLTIWCHHLMMKQTENCYCKLKTNKNCKLKQTDWTRDIWSSNLSSVLATATATTSVNLIWRSPTRCHRCYIAQYNDQSPHATQSLSITTILKSYNDDTINNDATIDIITICSICQSS